MHAKVPSHLAFYGRTRHSNETGRAFKREPCLIFLSNIPLVLTQQELIFTEKEMKGRRERAREWIKVDVSQ